jgi:hypothetical protein
LSLKGEFIMRNKVSKSNVKDWLRVAAKAGLLFTDPKVRSAVGDDLKERMGDVSDSVKAEVNGRHELPFSWSVSA